MSERAVNTSIIAGVLAVIAVGGYLLLAVIPGTPVNCAGDTDFATFRADRGRDTGDAWSVRRDVASRVEACEVLQGDTMHRVAALLGKPAGWPRPGGRWLYDVAPCDSACLCDGDTLHLVVTFKRGRLDSTDYYGS